MEFRTTNRGFTLVKFIDRYGMKCSLQKSSLMSGDAVWLGVDDAKPSILAADAKKLGVETSKITGWVPYPIPEEVSLHTRMHLTRDQVKELLPLLQYFAEMGEVPVSFPVISTSPGLDAALDQDRKDGVEGTAEFFFRRGWQKALNYFKPKGPGGPGGYANSDTLEDFQEGQWWLQELDTVAETGSMDLKRAVAVVRHLMATAKAPQPSAVKKAKKVGGSYQAEGTIVSTFKTLTGEVRHVFEFDYPAGMLHIFGPSQVEIEGPVKVDSEDRTKWTYKQWYEHVGAWEDKDGQIVFGSPMAVRAMMIQFGSSLEGRHAAVVDVLSKEDLELCRQWFNSVQDTNRQYLGAADYELAKRLYTMVGVNWTQRNETEYALLKGDPK